MSLYAMSDLHLSFYKEKPMDIFDSVWKDHPQKILERWNSTVSEDDTVLVPGDVSWGKNLNEATPDLEFIDNLKGKKILLTGNHDYYWNSTQKLNEMFDSMSFLKNNFYEFENYLICGTRGWICPGDTRYTDHDKKIYLREVGRLKLSLESAVNSSKFNDNIILMMHFPPTNDKHDRSEFIELIEKYNIPLDEYPRRCIKQIAEWEEEKNNILKDGKITHERSREYASHIMEAVVTNQPYKIGGNVINKGMIENLPADACVEVPCMIDGNGVNPCRVGRLPVQLAAMNMTNINVQLLTIEAAATKKKEYIYQAAMLDPHTAGELCIDDIVKMCDELIDAHGDYMKMYK